MTQINEALIRQYAEGATDFGIRNLLTLFDALGKQTTRAEELSRAYLAQMTVLQKRLAETREGESGMEGRPSGQRVQDRPQHPRPQQPASSRAEGRAVGSQQGGARSKPARASTPADAIDIDL